MYFDRQYNDTLGLLHGDAYEDSVALALDTARVQGAIEVAVRVVTDLEARG